MSDAPRISGFTLVRNATLLSYPFRESIRSLIPLVDELIINCGDSDDDTAGICAELQRESGGRVRVLRTKWEREGQSGGFQLKHQTDLALAECRHPWCFYLQSDEVLHEADYEKIRAAAAKADGLESVDGVLFDWVHFYGGYDWAIRGRNWYRRECRLFKNGRGISAFRDAQGFRRNGQRIRVVKSGARVFHYGYVRSAEGMRRKSEQMSQWWGEKPADAKELVRHVGLHRFRGTHPAVMAERLAVAAAFDPSTCRRRWDRNELKNAVTLIWESLVPYRIGEFRNYEIERA